MSVQIFAVLVVIGVAASYLNKFEKQMKELGISKTDIKILFCMLLSYILYRHYEKIMHKTMSLMRKRRHMLQLEWNR